MNRGARMSRAREDPKGLRTHVSMEIAHLNCIRRLVPVKGSILEYGSGFSTTWLRNQADPSVTIISVDHNNRYASKTGAILSTYRPADVTPEAEELLGEGWEDYVYAPFRHDVVPEGTLFDVVVVDGLLRNACLKHINELVQPDGWVVLHDAEQSVYEEGMASIQWLAAALPHPDGRGRQLLIGKPL